MPTDAATPDELADCERLITAWAERQRQENPSVLALDRLPDERRWFIRLGGEEKQFTTVWLWLREYTLFYETQFMPDPEENREQVFEYLLRLNARLYGMRFAIGAEDAVYLLGQLPVASVDDDELDRLLGSAFMYSEQYFRPAMRIGYASKFRG